MGLLQLSNKTLFFLAVLLVILAFCSDVDKTSATVPQIKGVSVYILSTPKTSYDFQGEIKLGLVMSGSNESMLTDLVDKAKKKFPQVDAIVLHDVTFERADAIKFK